MYFVRRPGPLDLCTPGYERQSDRDQTTVGQILETQRVQVDG